MIELEEIVKVHAAMVSRIATNTLWVRKTLYHWCRNAGGVLERNRNWPQNRPRTTRSMMIFKASTGAMSECKSRKRSAPINRRPK
jgi:hypothetical protein